MQATKQSFTTIVGGNNRQFVIPVFQRDYSWNRDQLQQLWDDIIHAGAPDTRGGHFTGSIVYIEAEEGSSAAFQKWLVIDGQQRLATLTLLLTALRDHIKESGWSGGDDSPTPAMIHDYYLENAHKKKDDQRHRLVLRRRDNTTLRKLIDKTSVSDLDEDVSELIVDAYQFFRSALNSPECDLDQVYRGVSHLDVVDVRLDRGVDDPQLVFESMNSTGVRLRQSDLVRNYLLMGLAEPEQTRLYEDFWHEIESEFRASEGAFDFFLRDYISLEQKLTRQIAMGHVYDEFKAYWRPGESKSVEALLRDMVQVARRYAWFLGIGTAGPRIVSEAMRRGRVLSTAQALLMMRLCESYDEGNLQKEELIGAAKLVESYLLRRAVLGWPSKGYWLAFARIAHRIDAESAFESLRVELARVGSTYRFPTNEEFRRALEERDLYGLRVCKHILNRMENAGHREPSPVGDYSIEHIMPQQIGDVVEWQEMLGEDWKEIHETWLHRLGNLTLTAYNSEYRNHPFQKKKEVTGGFEQSAVRLNEYVRNQDRWTEVQMTERGQELGARALDIWPFHNADVKKIREADIRDLRNRAARRDATSLDMAPHVRTLLGRIQESVRAFGDVIEVIEWKSVCFYGPSFFAELLPMAHRVRVILPVEFGAVESPDGLVVHDASTWKFVPNRTHTDADYLVDVRRENEVARAVTIIRAAFEQSRDIG